MKNWIYSIIMVISILGCTRGISVKEPEILLTEDEMTNILIEVNLLEGYLTNLNVSMPYIRDESLGKYKSILKKYDITFETYKENYDYYAQQHNFKEIQQKILDSLSVLETNLQDAPMTLEKELTYPQFRQLMESDNHIGLIKNSSFNEIQVMDSLARFYDRFPEKVQQIGMEMPSFKKSLEKIKVNKLLYQSIVKKAAKEIK